MWHEAHDVHTNIRNKFVSTPKHGKLSHFVDIEKLGNKFSTSGSMLASVLKIRSRRRLGTGRRPTAAISMESVG